MERAGFIALLVGVESTQDATLRSMGKGFTIEQVRRRFEVLRKSKMIINAYFIVGNIGETEEQMFSTASFARSLGVDLIHVSRLRSEPYSGVRELVEHTPGYHIDADGYVYSDAYSPQHIANLRKRIDRRFHTPLQVAHVVLKLARILNWRVKAKALLTIPFFLALLIATQVRRQGAQVAGHPGGLTGAAFPGDCPDFRGADRVAFQTGAGGPDSFAIGAAKPQEGFSTPRNPRVPAAPR